MSTPDFDEGEDRVCSTLRWKDVVLPASVTPADIDALIFVELEEPYWRKVARVVSRCLMTLETRSIPVTADVIAARIQELAESGQIESQGNLTMWRHSEVRRRPI
jgi:uncharacterized protein DUF3658